MPTNVNQSIGASSRLNLGCGTDVRSGYINIDSAGLPGVDEVWNLNDLPWPRASSTVTEILLINVLEHLPNLLPTIEELHRICTPGAAVLVRVPYYNSPDMFADPTHRQSFSERTFDFFDPAKRACIERPYYSSARFSVAVNAVFIRAFGVYIRVARPSIKSALLKIAHFVGSIVWVIEFRLVAIKGPPAAGGSGAR